MIDSGTLLQDRFLIEEKIGMGGMGAVYRAVDQKFGSTVAIKETFYGDTELGEAFEREARLLNGLHHPILPHVSDYFTQNGGHFLVMEFIEGEDLSVILKRGETFAVSTVMGWTMEILDGLDYLHSQDPPIIHRDIKPNNLKLTSRGRIVLLDFGMAKETSHHTLGAKSVFGYSRKYSPLEQIEGTGTDVRSDIFSLGATIYHLFTGKPPVDVLARASAIVGGRPDPLLPVNSINSDVPESVAAILNSALSLNQDNRFESAAAMSNALEYAIGTNAIAQKPENEHVLAFAANEVDRQAEEAAAYEAVIGAGAGELFEQHPIMSPEDELADVEPAQDLWRPEDDEKGAITTVPVDAEPSAAYDTFGAAAMAGTPMHRTISRSGESSRRTTRPGYVLWVPAALLGLALVLFGTYRAFRSAESAPAVSNEVATDATTDPAPDAPAGAFTETAVADGAQQQAADTREILEDQSEDDSRDFARTLSDAAVAPEDDEDEVPVRSEDAINLKKGPINLRREPSRRAAAEPRPEVRAAVPEAAPERPAVIRTPSRRASPEQSRRVVRPAFEQPRVSSIEAIFTGVPYERRRRWESDRDPSFEEEMRRRRARQIMRENRRRQLPF